MPISDADWDRQIHAESRGNQAAVSPVGATGVAQVMKDTGPEAAALAGLPWDEKLWKTDAAYNSAIGRAYMDKQLEDFGSYDKALAAYNWGPARLRRAIQAKGDDWKSLLPTETRNYIAGLAGGGTSSQGPDMKDPDIAMLMGYRTDRAQSPYPRANEQLGLDQLREMIGGGKSKPAQSGSGATPAPTEAAASPTPTEEAATERPRNLAQKAGRLALDVGGGMGGGALGFLLGGPFGAVAGAGLGSAGGSLLSETFDPSENPAGEAVMSGVMGAAGQGLASGLGHLLPTSIRPGGKELLSVLGKRLPVPGQYFDSKAMEVLHNVGMSSFVGADALEKATQAALTGARQGALDYQAQVAANLARGADELGQVAQAAAKLNASANIAQVKAAADALAKNTPADSGVRRIAEILRQTEGNALPFSYDATSAVANAVRNATPGLTPVTPKAAVGLKELRTQLLDIARNTTDTAERTAASKLAKMMDDAAETSLKNADPRLADQWRQASAFYKEGIQGEEIGKMLSQATVSGEKNAISGKMLTNALKDHRLDKMATQLSPAQLENLDKFAKALTAAEGGGSKAFTLVSNGLQVNAVIRTAMAAGGAAGIGGAVAGGGAPALAGAALVLLGPAAIAKALASPTVMRLMIAASRMPAGSKQAGILGTQLVSQMFREGILTADDVTAGQSPAAGSPTADSPQPTSGTPPQ